MKRKFAPVMITAAALITTVPTTQVFASEGINAETASDNITPLVINTENTQNTAQTSTEDTTQNAQEVNKQQTAQTEEGTPVSGKEQKITTEGLPYLKTLQQLRIRFLTKQTIQTLHLCRNRQKKQ